MGRRTKRLLWLVFLVVLVVLISSLVGRLPEKSVLVLDLDGTIEEERPAGVVAKATGPSVTVLHELASAIDTARTDDRITGLVVKIDSLDAGFGKIQELRARLLEFRKSKKPSICFLGGDLPGNREYYLASACEQVWLVPTAGLGITGLMSQATFLRGTLDKLGIYPDLYGIAEYKTARDFYTEKKFTPANREMTEAILRSAYNQYLTEVAEARKLDRAKFEELVKQGPYLNQEVLAKKLVDRAAYWDEVREFFKQKNEEWRPVALSRYLKEVENEGAEKIAVVHATGTILVGESDYSPVLGYIMGADSVAGDIRQAREDSSVKAIVLRVDSPGGSAVASEIIRREVELAKKSKPVVVSMSDVAGSGGYWISMSANKIVADPTTLTGSIGVVYGKMNISGLYSLLGLSTDHIAIHENSTLNWPQQNFTESQRAIIRKFMQDIYTNFTRGVAEGRKMSVEAVDKIGKGRVWTGEQAKGLGLVDEVGGFDRALAAAKQLAKIDADAQVQIVRFPEEKPFLLELMETWGQTRTDVAGSVAAELRRLVRLAEPVQARMPFDLVIR